MFAAGCAPASSLAGACPLLHRRRCLATRSVWVTAQGRPPAARDVARNRRARFDYEILETIECGVVLTGPEVKSARAGKASLAQSFCRVEGGELWMRGSNISENPLASAFDQYDPKRQRKLLASKREILKLSDRQDREGLTLVPLRMYFKENRWCKVEVAVARGKKAYDKRETIKRREQERGIRKIIKSFL